MKHEEIQEYWNRRGKEFGANAQATTNDFYMREIEINCLSNCLQEISQGKKGFRVADLGCGNGYSTMKMATLFSNVNFSGFDYAESMIKSANSEAENLKLENLKFSKFDLVTDEIPGQFDVIMSDRCLINLQSWSDQKRALKKIFRALPPGGTYLMIENFMDGQNNLNLLRKQFSLPEIPVRDHNLFFEKESLYPFLTELGFNYEFTNISSQYYLISRVIYSKICSENNEAPDYYDEHHRLGAKLPYSGNFGPIALLKCFKESS